MEPRRGTYTSGQVAKICRFSTAKVNKLIDTGELQGFKIPKPEGGVSRGCHRRVPEQNLIEFMVKHNLPSHWIPGNGYLVSFVTKDPELEQQLKPKLWSSLDTQFSESAFSVAFDFKERRPALMVLDDSLGAEVLLDLFDKLKGTDDFKDIPIVMLVSDIAKYQHLDARALLAKPVNLAELQESVITALGLPNLNSL